MSIDRRKVALGAAAATALAAVGLLATTRDQDHHTREPTAAASPTSRPPTPPTPQSPRTWVDTPVATRKGSGWKVPNPLASARTPWFAVVAEHLDPDGGQLERQGAGPGVVFSWPADGTAYSYAHDGSFDLLTDRGPFEHGCRYLRPPPPTNGTTSCHTKRLAGPHGERARISRYQRLCGAFDGSAAAYATCGDYAVAVAVERREGLIGYLVMRGRGTADHNPLDPAAMAAAAADPRLTLPDTALAVPSSRAAATVVSDHFPSWRPEASALLPDSPGVAYASGTLGRKAFGMTVRPAGGAPVCGRTSLVRCVERHVFGADDPTTVFVGSWDDPDWGGCCPRSSRAVSRQLVYVGPRHTVTVGLYRIVRKHGAGIGPELDQRMIDLLLDPRLQ